MTPFYWIIKDQLFSNIASITLLKVTYHKNNKQLLTLTLLDSVMRIVLFYMISVVQTCIITVFTFMFTGDHLFTRIFKMKDEGKIK